LVCAVLMPLSSFTVVAFSVLGIECLGRRWFPASPRTRP
jgi:hypothetical protein